MIRNSGNNNEINFRKTDEFYYEVESISYSVKNKIPDSCLLKVFFSGITFLFSVSFMFLFMYDDIFSILSLKYS